MKPITFAGVALLGIPTVLLFAAAWNTGIDWVGFALFLSGVGGMMLCVEVVRANKHNR